MAPMEAGRCGRSRARARVPLEARRAPRATSRLRVEQARRLPGLGLGNAGFGVSQKDYDLVTGKGYVLKIKSTGAKECAWSAPEFSNSIWLRKIEVSEVEIKVAPSLRDRDGARGRGRDLLRADPAGKLPWRCHGLADKGMAGAVHRQVSTCRAIRGAGGALGPRGEPCLRRRAGRSSMSPRGPGRLLHRAARAQRRRQDDAVLRSSRGSTTTAAGAIRVFGDDVRRASRRRRCAGSAWSSRAARSTSISASAQNLAYHAALHGIGRARPRGRGRGAARAASGSPTGRATRCAPCPAGRCAPRRDRARAAARAAPAPPRRADRRPRHRGARRHPRTGARPRRARTGSASSGRRISSTRSRRRPRRRAAQGPRAGARPGRGEWSRRRAPRPAGAPSMRLADAGRGGGQRGRVSAAASAAAPRLGLAGYLVCLNGIVWREVLRFVHQRERFFSALVRPLVWLFIFAAGFRSVLGVSIIPPYETYVLYEVYVTPGLIGDDPALQRHAVLALDGLRPRDRRDARPARQPLSALVPAHREADRRRSLVSLLQVYVFLLIAWFWEIEPPLARLPHGAAGLHAVGPDARRARPVPVLGHPAARELRGRHELRDLPDVLCLLGALSALAHPRSRARCSTRSAGSTPSPTRSS